MKLWIVEVKDDFSPVEVREDGLQRLDKHSNIPRGRGFPCKVGGVTAHTTLYCRVNGVCVCV